MSVPVSGEHHERAVEAAVYRAFQWLTVQRNPETPFEGSEADYVEAQFGAMLDAYLRSLRDQGVRLVDLREVVEWLRARHRPQAAVFWAEALERRFGSVSDGD